jgi:ribosomal protein S18 acetylase RimI-like enzyme
MKIILTESQYKLITEREDEKNIQEMKEIYDSFMDKINARDYILEDSDNFLNPYKWMGVFVNTPYGELLIKLTDRKPNRAGEYNRRAGMIVIYYCEMRISKNNRLLKLKYNHQTIQHEIVHFIDDMKNRMNGPGTSDITDDKYYNSPHEINAEFISIMNQIGGDALPDTFSDFMKSYREYSPITIKQFANLTDKNKKSFINRMYQYYTYLKDKQKENIGEQRVVRDRGKTGDIVKSFEDKGHYKWFNIKDSEFLKHIPYNYLEFAMKKSLDTLTSKFNYTLKRVVVKDKGEIVGYLVWANKGSELDDIGDNQTYKVIVATAIHPEYRKRGLFKMMLDKSGIQKPYLVQTSSFSEAGFWENMGCKVAKEIGDGNKIEKCN